MFDIVETMNRCQKSGMIDWWDMTEREERASKFSQVDKTDHTQKQVTAEPSHRLDVEKRRGGNSSKNTRTNDKPRHEEKRDVEKLHQEQQRDVEIRRGGNSSKNTRTNDKSCHEEKRDVENLHHEKQRDVEARRWPIKNKKTDNKLRHKKKGDVERGSSTVGKAGQLAEGEIMTEIEEDSADVYYSTTSHLSIIKSLKQEIGRQDEEMSRLKSHVLQLERHHGDVVSHLRDVLTSTQTDVVEMCWQLARESQERAALWLKYAERQLEVLELREQLQSHTAAPMSASSEQKCTRCLGCDQHWSLEEDAKWGVFFCCTASCPCCRNVTGEANFCERCFCLEDPFWPGP